MRNLNIQTFEPTIITFSRDGKREFMQKRNNLRTEKSKLAICTQLAIDNNPFINSNNIFSFLVALFNEISPDSPQFMKKSARPDSPLGTYVTPRW